MATRSRTREAKGLLFIPSQSDVQDLLAAIAKIETKEQIQTASERLTVKDNVHQPDFPPTREKWRLSKVLDSVANLCVSKTNHEVIATALRVDNKAETIELIIASNTDVQSSTVVHLQEIWKILKRISALCHKHHQLDPQDDTPPSRDVDDDRILQLLAKFQQLCLEFSFSRLQKWINEKFPRFSAININNLDPSHPFQRVRRCIKVLELNFTRDKGSVIRKPHHDDTEAWTKLWACLKATKTATDIFLDDGGFRGEDVAQAETFLGYQLYLRRIESFANDIEVLIKSANSPQCKHLFAFKFKVTPLPGLTSKAITVPQTPKDWETILEKALFFRNHYKADKEEWEDYVIDIEKVKEDTAYMAREAIKRDLVIHCEVKILLHIFKTENEFPGIPKAYTYIGVSKLSCRGCHAFFKSFNAANGTRFVTKGSHSKSYWPWQFPQPFPKSDIVLSSTYHFIADRWVGFYGGYMVKQVPLAPDSTAQTGTSGGLRPTNLDPYAVVDSLPADG